MSMENVDPATFKKKQNIIRDLSVIEMLIKILEQVQRAGVLMPLSKP
jgi:hypothetical protein